MSEQLSKNFFRHEFECPCGCGSDDVDMRLVEALQQLRDRLGAPVNVNSGVRCAKRNAQLKDSSKQSQHLLGKAADIRVTGYKPEQVASEAEEIAEFANGGVGLYDTFVHVDVRNGRARWDYRKKAGD